MSGLWGESEEIVTVTPQSDLKDEIRDEDTPTNKEHVTESNEMEEEDSDDSSNDGGGEDLMISVLKTAANSDGFFKHQQVGEKDLSMEEKKKIVRELISSRPAVFLQRFGRFLSEYQLDYFEDFRGNDFEVEFYLKETRQITCRKVRQQRVKNRRYAMLQRMLHSSDSHFSEAAMRERNPLLYQQLVGRFKTAEEKATDEAIDMTNCSLTNIIMEHMDLNKERDDKNRMEKEEAEEEFDTDDEETGDDKDVAELEGGKEFLKQEFINAAYQSFLAGKDPGLDYDKIDTDTTLDDLDVEEQEAQEKYFDDSDENDE